jgi:hypothetical protein
MFLATSKPLHRIHFTLFSILLFSLKLQGIDKRQSFRTLHISTAVDVEF